jgi:hypothetical protein
VKPPGSTAVSPNAAHFVRPQGAFGVRQLAAAFENDPMCPVFKGSMESGSKLSPKGSEKPTTN